MYGQNFVPLTTAKTNNMSKIMNFLLADNILY